MQSQSLPHSTGHSEPRRHPRSSPESPGQPWNSHTTHTEKRKRTIKPIPTSQKPDKQWVNTRNLSARLLTGGNQSPHTQTPPAQAVQPSLKPTRPPKCSPRMPQRYHRICPVQEPPTQHTGKKTRMRGPHLLQYINIYAMYEVNLRVSNIWVHGHQLIIYSCCYITALVNKQNEYAGLNISCCDCWQSVP